MKDFYFVHFYTLGWFVLTAVDWIYTQCYIYYKNNSNILHQCHSVSSEMRPKTKRGQRCSWSRNYNIYNLSFQSARFNGLLINNTHHEAWKHCKSHHECKVSFPEMKPLPYCLCFTTLHMKHLEKGEKGNELKAHTHPVNCTQLVQKGCRVKNNLTGLKCELRFSAVSGDFHTTSLPGFLLHLWVFIWQTFPHLYSWGFSPPRSMKKKIIWSLLKDFPSHYCTKNTPK